MPIPENFANFDIDNAGVTVWLFKKSGGGAGAAPTFSGRWIATTDELDAALKNAVFDARARIEEVLEYGLLAQNHEASVLAIDTLETFADRIIAATANPLPQRQIRNNAQIRNSEFYVIRLTSNGEILHAIHKTDASWKSRKQFQAIQAFFHNETMGLQEDPPVTLSRKVDFFIFGDRIYIENKRSFESVLSYRQAHEEEFAALRAEEPFAALFTDIAPLVAFVGTNRIQLRRVCAIRQKGHYRNQDFMQRLRAQFANYNLTIHFDENGRVNPTLETCADIITALLDHRLTSAFSENIYDVPDATRVN
ncbi:Kiwa anti-phage protein KwaB-like domain-containing protein [Sphingorhabdus contaminans]|nr:Kiwa anti-phage protein KwaB-like domain-containing protein [Sphingorhabdus contaminans]